MNNKSLMIAAGIGGVVMGLVSGIPGLSLVNCLCCAGLWGSGILAVFLYRATNKEQPGLSVGQGALLGLLAGLVGGVLGAILSGIGGLILGAGADPAAALAQFQQIPGAEEYLSQIPPEMLSGASGAGGNFFSSLLCNVVLYPLFGALGGVIATALIWKKS